MREVAGALLSCAGSIALMGCTGSGPSPLLPYVEWLGASGDGIGNASTADLDGDGTPEVLLGGRLRGYIVSHLATGTLPDGALSVLEAGRDEFGQPSGAGASGVGDVDGDGVDDLRVGDGYGPRIHFTDRSAPYSVSGESVDLPADVRVMPWGSSGRWAVVEDDRVRVTPITRQGVWSRDIAFTNVPAPGLERLGGLIDGPTADPSHWVVPFDAFDGEEPRYDRLDIPEFDGSAPWEDHVVDSWTVNDDRTIALATVLGPRAEGGAAWAVLVPESPEPTRFVPLGPPREIPGTGPIVQADANASATVLDVNGDGVDDLLLSGATSKVFLGPFDEPGLRTTPDAELDLPPDRVVHVADVDVDGVPDLFVGMRSSSAGGPDAGAVRLYFGAGLFARAGLR